VTDESIDSPRMVKAFRDLPAGLWRLFKDIREYNGEIIRRTINR